MIFGSIKEGIMEPLEDRFGDFKVEIATGQLWDHRELKACGAQENFGKEDPFASSCHEGLKVDYASCLFRELIP